MQVTARAIINGLSIILIFIFFIWGLGQALIPLVGSFALAYLIFPLIVKLESKGIHRNHAVIGVCTFILAAITISLFITIPILTSDLKNFTKELPLMTIKIIENLQGVLLGYGYELDLSKEAIQAFVEESFSKISANAIKDITLILKNIFSGVSTWLIGVLNLFLFPLFFVYVINDYEEISKSVNSYIPKKLKPKVKRQIELCNRVLNGYIRGQLMVAAILGLLYAIGLSLIGLKFGFLVGVLSGLISIIPYAGFTIGFISTILIAIAYSASIGTLAGIVGIFLLVQLLEGTIITPRLVGDKVGLNSLAAMLALIIGGNAFGIFGMILAIPIAAILKSILNDLKNEYQKLDIYN
ncbi:MAG: AI-2E family transporter [Bdellovibrionota bacterium]